MKRIRRGTFTSVTDLKEAIHDYATPIVWTKTAEAILAKERRALNALEATKGGNQALESQH